MGKQKLLDRLLSPEDQERVLSQIRQIEKNSSGEVRVHLTDQPVKDVYQAARKTFSALALRRNGLESMMRRNRFAAWINLAAWVTGVLCCLAWYLFYRSWS